MFINQAKRIHKTIYNQFAIVYIYLLKSFSFKKSAQKIWLLQDLMYEKSFGY